MAVAADFDVGPTLDEVRELARDHTLVPLRHTFIDDIETPVSAYLKLRGEGPSFLLESAEQGQRVGRWSFLGVAPRTVMRLEGGGYEDPYGAVAQELERYRLAPLEGLPPFSGGAVGMFGYDLVRSAEPTVGQPNADEVGIPDLALMVSDVLVAFDHFTHTVTVLANVFVEDDEDLAARYAEAVTAIVDVRERLSQPVPRAGAAGPGPPVTGGRYPGPGPGGGGFRSPFRPRWRGGGGRRGGFGKWARTASHERSTSRRSTSGPATSTRWCPRSAGRRTRPSSPSRSTAACARSTRARTCTSSTSRTSRSRVPRPRRW